MPFVTTSDKTTLFYNDWGAGRPVVLIHGWPLDSDMWEYQARALAESGLRVIAYDRRGFGRSAQPWTGYNYDTLAADLATVLEALDISDAVLVGFSMGGGEVARYLAAHGRDRVSKAVLVSAVTPFLLRTDSNPNGADPGIFEEMIAGLKADRPGFLATFGKKFYGSGLLSHPVSAEILTWSSQMALLASPKATLDCVRAFSATDFRGDCARIGVLTLVIHGNDDQTVPIDISGRAAHALIAGSRLIEYDGAPHGLVITEKDRLTADLLDFARA